MHGIVTEMGQVDHWRKIENLEMNPHTYSLLNFDKGDKVFQWKRQHFKEIVLVQLKVSM